jgi:FixJ family two-component response regulator
LRHRGIRVRRGMTPSRKVAIVDDDRFVLWSAANLIQSFGVDTATFESAEAFLADDADAFDCIISDVQMGGMSGLDLQDELNRRGIGTPLMLVTAFPNDSIRERAMAAGACCLLEKPWSTADVVGHLERIMGPLD